MIQHLLILLTDTPEMILTMPISLIFSPTSFTQEEQKGIILTSVGVCVGIGITDLVVQIIKRSSRKRIKPVNYDDISVIPISEDEDASIIPLPSSDSEKVNEIQEIEE